MSTGSESAQDGRISGLRGVRAGRKRAVRQKVPPSPRSNGSACSPWPSVEADDREGEELARDGRVGSVPNRCPESDGQ